MYKIILLFFINFSFAGFGQTRMQDSLFSAFQIAKHDSTRCDIYLQMGDFYENVNSDSALFYYDQCLQLAIQKKYKILQVTSFRYIGNVLKDQGNYDKALENYLNSFKVAEETSDKRGMAKSCNNIGTVHYFQGNYDLAIEYYLKSLRINEESGDKKDLSRDYNNLGSVYLDKGNYDMAIEYYLKSLRIREKLGDKSAMSGCYNNIGNVHFIQGNYKQAGNYYLKSIEIDEFLGDKKGMAMCYANMGNVYYYQGNSVPDSKRNADGIDMDNSFKRDSLFIKAIEFYLKSLKFSEELGDKNCISDCYGNIGAVHEDQANSSLDPKFKIYEFGKAIENYLVSLKIKEELGNKLGIALAYGNISGLYLGLANATAIMDSKEHSIRHLKLALDFGEKSLILAKEIKSLRIENIAAKTLMDVWKLLGDYKNAMKYSDIYIATRDSMFNEEKTNALASAEKKFESEKKQLEIEKLNKEKGLQKSELLRQKLINICIVAGLILIAVFAAIVMQRLRVIRNQKQIIENQMNLVDEKNNLLNQQNEEIRAQRDEIETHHKLVILQKDHIEEQKQKITDSINYALRIQQAVMPTGEYADKILGEYFIFFKPKDIVSGDFYWAARVNEKLIVTVADCTGHGVPGAFMSMLGVSFLNEIVRKKDVTKASEVLDHLKGSIIEALQQKGARGEQKDGMDIAFCVINFQTQVLNFAGANNPLYIVSALKELTIIKPDKQTLALDGNTKAFTNHEIPLKKGDCIYMVSDGYIDQFGGPKSKKFLADQLTSLLQDIAHKPMNEQQNILNQEFENWKGDHEQIDDVTILGLRI